MVEQNLSQLLIKYGIDDKTAQQIQNNINGSDLINLINSLNLTNSTQAIANASRILSRYGVTIKEAMMNNNRFYRMYKGSESEVVEKEEPIENLTSISESDRSEDHMLALEGFNYLATLDPKLGEELMDWLEGNKVEFLTNGEGHFHIKCEDRDHAYKVGRTISGLMRRQRLVRDSNDSGEQEMVEKNEYAKREKIAKDKLAKMRPRDPNALAARMMQAKNGGAINKEPKSIQKYKIDSKHKKKWDEEIETVNEAGVFGLDRINPLFRLRELAGLPPAPIDDTSGPIGITHDVPDLGDIGIDDHDDFSDIGDLGDMDAGSMASDINPQMAAGAVIDADDAIDDTNAIDVVKTPTESSPAMKTIDDHLNNVQLNLSEIKLSEYKIVLHKLQDLANQLQSMGKDYLGERRRLKEGNVPSLSKWSL